MISLEQTREGIILSVKASAGARRNGITGAHAGAVKVSVTQAPEKGKANDAILQALADELDLKKNQIHLVSGLTSPQKKFLIMGIPVDELQSRLGRILASESK